MKAFNWKDVDLNLLVAFQALYQCQSVSQAAEQCFVSQSAMSYTLQRLRGLFDDRLFERVGIRMEPTQRAKNIAPVIDGLLASIKNDLLIQPEFSASEFKGVWKIGLTDYAEQLFAPALYDAIGEVSSQSQVRFFNVNRGNYSSIVEREHVDAVIGSIDNLDQRFASEKLYTEQHLCLFDPETVPFENTISVEEFVAVEHALVSPDGKIETKVDKELASLGCKRRVAVTSRNFLTIRRLLLGRKLLCVVPKRFAETEMYSHALKALSPPISVPDFDISLIYLKAQQGDDKNRWLREIIAKTVVA
ncbi:LysR family transcriptional regulator [Vibrio sp. HN007]|uniref:LysR family transcriptional regulator n=1 Tax=Vibrio iocasae TaxID=3098914 RepID=UPI0035D48FAE